MLTTARSAAVTEPPTAERIDAIRRQCRAAPPGSALRRAARCRTRTCSPPWTSCRPTRTTCSAQRRAGGDQPRRDGAATPSSPRSWRQTNRGVVALYAELDETTRSCATASESKTRFLANVSHELRAPVNSVLGLARLLLDPGPTRSTAEQRHQVELIRDSGRRPADAGQRAARPGQGRVGPDRAAVPSVDLGALLRRAARHAAPAGRRRTSSWSSTCPGPVWCCAPIRAAARPDPAQPAHQRDQVHRARARCGAPPRRPDPGTSSRSR